MGFSMASILRFGFVAFGPVYYDVASSVAVDIGHAETGFGRHGNAGLGFVGKRRPLIEIDGERSRPIFCKDIVASVPIEIARKVG
jgi:hypothetical protein